MARRDRERLDDFASTLYRTLNAVVFDHVAWLPEELHEHYRAGLTNAERSLGELRAALLWETAYRDQPDDLVFEQVDDRLRWAGLTDADLELKLAGYDLAQRRFSASPTRRILKSLLRWANVILGSLVAAIGAGEALKEFKESIEAGVADIEDAEQPDT